MKKKLSLLGITLLCSSALATTIGSPSNVHAEENTTSESTSISESRAELQRLVNEGNIILTTPEKYTTDSISRLETAVYNSQTALDYNMDDSYDLYIWSMNNALSKLVENTESTSSSSSESESSNTESTSSSSSESSSTESTSPSSSESESSSTESTSSSSSESESSSTESSNSSSSEELKPTINVSDKTMYVGDKLTEEDILNWATFENADGLKVGFEVIGDPIQVYNLGSTLIEPGVHQIRYYVEATTRNSQERYLAEKTITLTIKTKGTEDTNSSTTSSISNSTGNTNTTNSSGTYTKPVGKTTPISSASTTAGLPQTGETNSPLLPVIGSMTLLVGGAYVLTLKRKKNN